MIFCWITSSVVDLHIFFHNNIFCCWLTSAVDDLRHLLLTYMICCWLTSSVADLHHLFLTYIICCPSSVSCGPDPPLGTVPRQLDKTYSCYGSRQTLTSPSDSVFCLVTVASHARFLSDTAHHPMVTSKSVCRTTVPDSVSGPFAPCLIPVTSLSTCAVTSSGRTTCRYFFPENDPICWFYSSAKWKIT